MKKKKVFLGADHGGFEVKEFIKNKLLKKGFDVHDLGTYSNESVDYPDFAKKVAINVVKNKGSLGVVACGTGIGVSIAANKVKGIRAALVHDAREARLSRQHNDANILAVGGRPYNKANIGRIVNTWFSTAFEGGRHARRIKKISQLEQTK